MYSKSSIQTFKFRGKKQINSSGGQLLLKFTKLCCEAEKEMDSEAETLQDLTVR